MPGVRAALRDGGPCPLDGTEIEHRDDGLDLAVHQTVAHGGTGLGDRLPPGSRSHRRDRGALAILERPMASLARTILEEHLARGELVPGTEIAISIDQALARTRPGRWP